MTVSEGKRGGEPRLVPLRRRVDRATFVAWLAAMPGLVPPCAAAPGTPPVAETPVPPPGVAVPPPEVAAALAVVAGPAAQTRFRRADSEGATLLQGCVVVGSTGRSPGLAASVVMAGGWAEVALLPLAAAVEEVTRWAPAAAWSGERLEVHLVRPGEETLGWVVTGGSADGLAAGLRLALAGCLSAELRGATGWSR